MQKQLGILGEYVGHLVVGGAMFAALLSFAVGLNVLVEWSQPLVPDVAFGRLMRIVEKVILYADAVFVIWWTAFSTYNAIMELHDE